MNIDMGGHIRKPIASEESGFRRGDQVTFDWFGKNPNTVQASGDELVGTYQPIAFLTI